MGEFSIGDNGLISNIQSYSVHDGPGCRTTIFLAGCFLKCSWCANPESWDLKSKVMFAKTKCQYKSGCTSCIRACRQQGVYVGGDGKIQLDWSKCCKCTDFLCADACYTEALKVCGEWYSKDRLMQVINRERDFWGSEGGVTFSGGEPFYQKTFLKNMVESCKRAYIHTAIETTAYINSKDFLATMKFLDFAFIDVKHMNSVRHKEKTGVDNYIILNNIAQLIANGWKGRLILRMPVIEDFNDTVENVNDIADFMDKVGIFEINLLPFHRLGDSKWEQLGKKYEYREHSITEQATMEELQEVFLKRRIACYIGSDTKF